MVADRETMATTEEGSGKERDDVEEEEEEANEERQEAALASTSSLQPDFKRPSVTQQQILKLQELHKRRLQIKAKSKIHKKVKGEVKKSQNGNLGARTTGDKEISAKPKEWSSSDSEKNDKNGGSSTQVNNEVVYRLPKKAQKLYWGLDTKERWERKANM